MITLIIGTEKESEEKAISLIDGRRCFSSSDALSILDKNNFFNRDVLVIKNLDNKLLFESLCYVLDRLIEEKMETIAITYRDDIIEAYEDDEDVNIIDLRGE